MQRIRKGVPFVNRRYTKGVPFPVSNMVYKRLRGWTLGRGLLAQNFVEYPPEGTDRFSFQLVKMFFSQLNPLSSEVIVI